MGPDCYLIANASLARLFIRKPRGKKKLIPLFTLEHPQSRSKGVDLADDRPGHEATDRRYGGTSFPARTDPRRKEHQHFAQQLAQRLHEGLNGGEYEGLYLFASSPFLGELKAALDAAVARTVRATVDLDLTSYELKELEQRVTDALPEVAKTQ